MFYVNNKQVLGIFLNGNNYNYMAFGFGKIIPENRNAQFAYINLAQRYLSQYRVEYGNIQSGYDNFPVARLDYPVNGIFHSPLTYYYGGNIVPTKNVPVYINNGYCALRGTVYNDINVNGNIVYFAANSDFQGHNVNIHPENFRSTEPYFNGTVMDNCSNFTLHSASHLSKSSQVTLYDCKKFIGWFNFFGDNDGTRYPGFRGFLHTCRDGVFSFNLMNMHGGGDGIYSFSCISNCDNLRVNINGSTWQAWVHPNCYCRNCNINTMYIVPGFDRMSHCNFNLSIPGGHVDVEKSAFYSILSNSSNCNVYFDGINSNLYSFRNGEWGSFLFEGLNDCNLNLLLNNSNGLDYGFGNRLNNCNIKFDNTNFLSVGYWLSNMNNCNLTGSVRKADHSTIDLVAYSTNVNVDVNASSTNNFSLLWNSSYINGNAILGKEAIVQHSNNLILNLYNGNNFTVLDVRNSKFRLDNTYNVDINGAYDSNFNLHNCNGYSKLYRLSNVTFIDRFDKTTITNLDNCFSSHIYVKTVKGLIENVYNTYLSINEVTEYNTVNVYNCDMGGFPSSASYHTEDCTFRTSLEIAQMRFRSYFTWANVWPHATPRGSDGWEAWYSTNAGLESTANLSRCYLNNNNASIVNSSSISFDNNNNMRMSLLTYYSGTVKVNLPNYAINIKLNVDCHNLNLGVFMAGPPHGLEYSSISADNIFCNTGNNYFVQMNYGTRIYCENFCNVAFSPVWRRFSDNYQPVLLINNYHLTNDYCEFYGGITRIGQLNYIDNKSVPLELYNGACMFINNTVISDTIVDNALLFLGTNVRIAGGGITVTNGGLVVNKANYSMDAIGKFVNRKNFAWNFTDSGPWGWRSLLNFCIDV